MTQAVMPYYRFQAAEEDPKALLDPANQFSEPWNDDDLVMRGVSVFADPDKLYRYMVKRKADVSGCVMVELEGDPSPDEDVDADEGAELVFPTHIVAAHPIDSDRVRQLREQLAEERPPVEG
jgi:hypothetical protein